MARRGSFPSATGPLSLAYSETQNTRTAGAPLIDESTDDHTDSHTKCTTAQNQKAAATAFVPIIAPHRRHHCCGRAASTPTTRLSATGPGIDFGPVAAASSFLALAPEAQMVFEPKLDGGALASLVVVASVVLLFWARVWVAVSDRLKR